MDNPKDPPESKGADGSENAATSISNRERAEASSVGLVIPASEMTQACRVFLNDQQIGFQSQRVPPAWDPPSKYHRFILDPQLLAEKNIHNAHGELVSRQALGNLIESEIARLGKQHALRMLEMKGTGSMAPHHIWRHHSQLKEWGALDVLNSIPFISVARCTVSLDPFFLRQSLHRSSMGIFTARNLESRTVVGLDDKAVQSISQPFETAVKDAELFSKVNYVSAGNALAIKTSTLDPHHWIFKLPGYVPWDEVSVHSSRPINPGRSIQVDGSRIRGNFQRCESIEYDGSLGMRQASHRMLVIPAAEAGDARLVLGSKVDLEKLCFALHEYREDSDDRYDLAAHEGDSRFLDSQLTMAAAPEKLAEHVRDAMNRIDLGWLQQELAGKRFVLEFDRDGVVSATELETEHGSALSSRKSAEEEFGPRF